MLFLFVICSFLLLYTIAYIVNYVSSARSVVRICEDAFGLYIRLYRSRHSPYVYRPQSPSKYKYNNKVKLGSSGPLYVNVGTEVWRMDYARQENRDYNDGYALNTHLSVGTTVDEFLYVECASHIDAKLFFNIAGICNSWPFSTLRSSTKGAAYSDFSLDTPLYFSMSDFDIADILDYAPVDRLEDLVVIFNSKINLRKEDN